MALITKYEAIQLAQSVISDGLLENPISFRAEIVREFLGNLFFL